MAILLVLVHHAVRYGGMQPAVALDRLFQKMGTAGWSGVDLFFVLSGFLITGILLDAKGRHGYFRNFYIRRILRIFPLYYGFLFCAFVVLPHVVTRSAEYSALLHDQLWYWTYLQNAAVALKGWPPVAALDPLWSLAVEEQFYLVWPLLVLALSRRGLIVACLAIAAASLGIRCVLLLTGHPLGAYVLTPSRMDALSAGGLLATLARTPGGLSRLARLARPAVAVSSLGLLAIVLWRHNFHYWDWVVRTAGFSLLAVLFAGILALVVTSPHNGLTSRFFAHPILRSFGRYSYAMYVFHLPALLYLTRFFTAASVPTLAGSQLPGQIAVTFAVAGVSLAAAVLSGRFYEAPILKLKTLFPYNA